MSLSSGARVGPYEVLGSLGAGGMGEVYRARDTELGRDVALKVLPDRFAADTDRLNRLRREAQLLASLNHPNIGHIYGIEGAALVLEFVDGTTLAERLKGGAMRPAEALQVARHVALALEAAHDRGVIHRDLKPANIKIRPDGTAKVLDFGLAKAIEQDPAGDQGETVTVTALTHVGTVLGTPAYMSPEQARGQTVDARTDIWAFGCVLFEMLTGKRAFDGSSSTDTLAAVLTREPDWSLLPVEAPVVVRRVLRRCLASDLSSRFRHIGDALLDLNDSGSAPAEAARSQWTPRRVLSATAILLAAAAIGGFTVWRFSQPTPMTQHIERHTLMVPELASIRSDGFALSRDGRVLAYVSGTPARLIVRSFSDATSRAVEGSEGADAPFFSSDGRTIAFFAGGKLKRVPAAGGQVTGICDADHSGGGAAGTWSDTDTIVFAVASNLNKGLFQIPAAGGVPTQVTAPDPQQEGGHGQPWFVDGTSAFLYRTRNTRSGIETSIRVHSLDTGTDEALELSGGSPMFSAGHLVFLSEGVVRAVPFNRRRLKTEGTPIQVEEGVARFVASATGRLVYASSMSAGGPLVWVDRRKRTETLVDDAHAYGRPRLSPDNTKLAVEILEGGRSNIGIYRLDTGNLTPVTTDGNSNSPIWRDDATLVFRRRGDLFISAIDSTAPVTTFIDSTDPALTGSSRLAPGVFTRGGDWFYFVMHGTTASAADIWRMEVAPRRFDHFLQRQASQWGVRVSPDGLWISYSSNETGRFEVWIESIADRRKYKVSTAGGTEAVWSRDGRELFFRSGNQMLAAPISSRPGEPSGAAHELFSGSYVHTDLPHYDVTLDGMRFVMIKEVRDPLEGRFLRVVDHWAATPTSAGR